MTNLKDNLEIKKLITNYFLYIILLLGCFYSPNLSENYLLFLKILYFMSIIPLTVIVFIPNKSIFIWPKRLLFYYIVMLVSLFITSLILLILEHFLNYNINFTDIDNARYMLSSLIQSESAIIAIVITLTLVAVQQTSSLYSTRLIDIFKYRNPDFWILLIIYITSIIYQVSILINLNENTISNGHIFFSFFCGLFSILALIPYILNTINLLKPSTILSFLSEKIAINRILSLDPMYFNLYGLSYKREIITMDFYESDKDPVLPIVDIITSSLMKYDYGTSRNGVILIKDPSLFLLENSILCKEKFNKIYTLFSKHFINIGKLAISKGDNLCSDLILNWFYEATSSIRQVNESINIINSIFSS